MARAPALQAGGRGFEPHILHSLRARGARDGSLTGWEREIKARHRKRHGGCPGIRDTRHRHERAGAGGRPATTGVAIYRRRGPRAERPGGERASEGARGMP